MHGSRPSQFCYETTSSQANDNLPGFLDGSGGTIKKTDYDLTGLALTRHPVFLFSKNKTSQFLEMIFV